MTKQEILLGINQVTGLINENIANPELLNRSDEEDVFAEYLKELKDTKSYPRYNCDKAYKTRLRFWIRLHLIVSNNDTSFKEAIKEADRITVEKLDDAYHH